MKGKQVAPEVAEQIQTIEKLWKYTEKQLRRELLMSKYQSLLMASVTVNPVSAKAQFEARTQSANALVAAFPYGTISDKEVKVEDSDLKDAYKRFKELFRLNNEVRDLKYIDYIVSASPADRKAVEEQVKAIYAKLEAGQDPAVVINASKSQTHFVNLPLAAEAYPADVRSELESMSVGSMKAPYVNDQDNTFNVVKLISKVQAPDSVAYRALPVQAADATATATRAPPPLIPPRRETWPVLPSSSVPSAPTAWVAPSPSGWSTRPMRSRALRPRSSTSPPSTCPCSPRRSPRAWPFPATRPAPPSMRP